MQSGLIFTVLCAIIPTQSVLHLLDNQKSNIYV